MDLTKYTNDEHLMHAEFWKNSFAQLDGSFQFQQLKAADSPREFREILELSQEAVANISRIAGDQKLGQAVLVINAIQSAMMRFEGREDMLLVTPSMLKEGVTLYENQVLGICQKLDANATLKANLTNTQKTLLEAYKLQHYPMSLVEGAEEKLTSATVAFTVEGLHCDVEFASDVALVVEMEQTDNGFVLSASFADGAANTLVQSLLKATQTYLEALSDIEQKASEVTLVDVDELNALKQLRTVDYDATSIAQLFLKQAKQTPNAIAVVHKEQQFTYAEIKDKALALAHFLQNDWQIEQGDKIAILCNRSENTVVSILGTWMAGAAYVPLDVQYPVKRVNFILEQTGAKGLLIDSTQIGKVGGINLPMFMLDLQMAMLEAGSADIVNIDPKGLAYVLYTSGSTGEPKGVCVSHKAVANTLQWRRDFYAMEVGNVHMQFPSIAFDGALTDIFTSLLSGATLLVPQEADKAKIDVWIDLIQKHGVTDLLLTPSFYQVLLENGQEALQQSVKGITLVGEATTASLVTQHNEKLSSVELFNEYGPTENAVCSTVSELEQGVAVTIGRPITNVNVHIVDDNGELLPLGVYGEMALTGAGLADGYFNNPGQTADKFKTLSTGELAYFSGDVGALNAEGEIVFLGRKDNQVKIRGYRVEPGEVENVISAHSKVTKAIVSAVQKDGEYQLIAFVEAPHDFDQVKTDVATQLPEYMQPSNWMPIIEWPMTTNDKIDIKLLVRNWQSGGVQQSKYVAPTTDTEITIQAIWQDVLGLEEISIESNFFEIGGHSLKGTQIAAKLKAALQVDVDLDSLFKFPTIKELAAQIDTLDKISVEEEPAIEAIDKADDYAVSPAQKRMWMLSQFEANAQSYNISGALQLNGAMNVEAFQKALRAMIDRHEILRTIFVANESEQVRQKVLDADEVAEVLSFSDLRQNENPTAKAQSLAQETALATFDLATGPLLRTSLMQTDDEQYLFVYVMHHIISDGWSMEVMIRELLYFYNAFSQNASSNLPELNIQYKDYSAWVNELQASDTYQQDKAFWLEQFAGTLPVLDLPTDLPRPAVQSYRGANHIHTFKQGTIDALTSATTAQNTTLFVGFLAGMNALFSRYTGKEDIVIGTPTAGRDLTELEAQIGFYLNTMAIRTKFDIEQGFEHLLRRQRDTWMAAYKHQSYEFDNLVSELNIDRDMSRGALFDVWAVMQNQGTTRILNEIGIDEGFAGLTAESVEDIVQVSSKFDMSFMFGEVEGQTRLQLEYNTDIFTADTAARMAEQFEALLVQMVENPSQPIATIDLLAEKEVARLKTFETPSSIAYPENTLVSLWNAQAAKTPQAIAVSYEGTELTYADLDQQSSNLAQHLVKEQGVNAQDVVGIMLERSEQMVIAMLGVLKAGAAYLPIDPSYPSDRIAFMIEDAAPKALLIDAENMMNVGAFDGAVFVMDFQLNGLPTCEEALPQPNAEQLAYIIYTSGSSGKPKGVLVEHRNICNTLQWRQGFYGFGEGDVNLQVPSFSFDSSVEDIFSFLISGGKIVILEEARRTDLGYVSKLITEHQVTHFLVVPSLYNVLLQEVASDLSSLKAVTVAGEATLQFLVELHHKLLPNVKLYNEYGPTENAVCSTATEVQLHRKITIGKPIANVQCFVLDSNKKRLPIGVPGELVVAGKGVVRGYLNRPELNAKKFIENTELAQGKLYTTGDLVRWTADGELEFLGRVDQQVKIRGYRVELGEIENLLINISSIEECVVDAYTEASGSAQLVGFVVAADEIDTAQLKQTLANTLPEYMVPSQFVQLEEMPHLPNGKIDRNQLPQPTTEAASKAEYVAPETELECAIAEMWKEILDVEKVGVKDNFFDLGGQSLKATQLKNRIDRELNININLTKVFTQPTIEALVEEIQQLEWMSNQDSQDESELHEFENFTI